MNSAIEEQLCVDINAQFSLIPLMGQFVRLHPQVGADVNLAAVQENLAEMIKVLQDQGARYQEMEAELNDYRRTQAGLQRLLGLDVK